MPRNHERPLPPMQETNASRAAGDFEENRRAFIEDLDRLAPSLDRYDRVDVAKRLIEHDLFEGIRISQDHLGLDRDDVLIRFTDPGVQLKHPEALLRIASVLKSRAFQAAARGDRHLAMMLENDADYLRSPLDHAHQAASHASSGSYVHFLNKPQPGRSRHLSPPSPEADRLLTAVDALYAPLLTHHELRPQKQLPEESEGLRRGEANLEQMELALTPHYYTGSLRELLMQRTGLKTEKALDGRLAVLFDAQDLKLKDVISAETVTHILSALGLPQPEADASLRRALERARYKPGALVFQVEHREATKLLQKEIRQALPAGTTLQQDPRTKEWEVVLAPSDGSPRPESAITLDRELFDWSRFERKTNERAELQYIDHVIDVDGEVAFSGWRGAGMRVMVYPDGSRSKSYEHIRYANAIGGKVFFQADDYDEPSYPTMLVRPDGTEIRNIGDMWDVHGMLAYTQYEEVDGRSKQRLVVEPHFKSGLHDEVSDAVVVQGEIVYSALDATADGASHRIITQRGKVLSTIPLSDDDLRVSLVETADSFGTIIKKQDHDELRIPYTQKRGKTFPYIVATVSAKDGVYAEIENPDDSSYVAYPDGSHSKTYDEISWVTAVDQGVAYAYRHGLKSAVKYPDGNDSDFFESIIAIQNIAGQAVFIAHDGKSDVLVYPDGGTTPIPLARIRQFHATPERITIIGQDPQGNCVSLTRRFEAKEQGARSDVPPQVQKKLALLNTLEHPSEERIARYWSAAEPERAGEVADDWDLLDRTQRAASDALSRSAAAAKGLSRAVASAPKAFLHTIAAVRNRNPARQAERLVDRLFPESVVRSRASGARRQDTPSAATFLDGGVDRLIMADGDPSERRYEDVLRLREPVSGMIATTIGGRYHRETGTWERFTLPVAMPVWPARETTFEIPDTRGLASVHLPKLVDGTLLPDRVKGIRADGEEVALVAEVDAAGMARLDLPRGISRVAYSQSVPEQLAAPDELSSRAYERFTRGLERSYGDGLTEPLMDLPDDLRPFVQKLKTLPPTERLIAIESFMRQYGHYDMQNKEAQAEKEHASLEDRLDIMRERMRALAAQNPTLGEKRFAGVCADFNLLAAALMRASGIPSGVIAGFLPTEGASTVTTNDAHAIAFALWPADGNRVRLIQVDGTPQGANPEEERRLASFRLPSLAERAEKHTGASRQPEQESDARLAELEALLARTDADGIQKLENGELERTLNAILSHVKEPHLAAVERVLQASRYAGFNIVNIARSRNAEDEAALREFLASELEKERRAAPSEKGGLPRGERLVSALETFVTRYAKDVGVGSRQEALNALDAVFRASRDALDPVEARSFAAVLTYLKARRMGIHQPLSPQR